MRMYGEHQSHAGVLTLPVEPAVVILQQAPCLFLNRGLLQTILMP